MFKNMKKISTKLIVSFIIVTIISSIAGIFGLFMLKNTDTKYSDALVINGFAQGDIGQFNTYLNKGAALTQDIVLQTDLDDIKASQQELENATTMANDAFARLRPNCQTPEELSLISTLDENLTKYRASRDRVIALGLQNKNDEAMEIFYSETRPFMVGATDAGDQLMTLNVKMGNEVSENLSNSTTITMLVIIIIVAASALISILFAILMAKSISKPIIAVQKAAGQLEQGDLKIDVHTDIKDEIGQMANSFTAAATKIRMYISDLSRVFSEIAAKNFNVSPEEDYKGNFKEIEESAYQIIISLSDTLGQINMAADQVSAGSDQVSAGAQALSQGATEQASSVEELAATINEISGQVKETADNARQTSSLVDSTGMKVLDCDRQMQELSVAMDEISQTSGQIKKIIKTIEDIAFQTNILALNAAVEAARAGAAGKGFAVVADEVRSLASKSAEAAKDTTALIESSIHAVENGTKLTEGTAESLKMVVESAKVIETTVARISEATDEQSASLNQVTTGIDQISAVVQTNSATAEESAAASEELSGQASMLKQLVGKFKLKDTDSVAAQPVALTHLKVAKSMSLPLEAGKY